MKQAFIDKRFQRSSVEIIAAAEAIIEEYAAQGYSLTLRQLYYQFVARGYIPNNMRSYKRLGSIINDARLAGYIDWLAIEDRTRNVHGNPHWDTPADIVESCRDQYREDLWASQPRRVEVWIEKEALVGVIAKTCRDNDVPYFACRGYVSQSEQWRAYRRSLEHPYVILHLGDHDPSGIDMTRDNDDRLNDVFGGRVEVRRLALNIDQVEHYNPPPNPAKLTDSRVDSYIAQFGSESWELDALEPSVINDLIQTNIDELRDDDAWDEAVAAQEANRERLTEVLEQLQDDA